MFGTGGWGASRFVEGDSKGMIGAVTTLFSLLVRLPWKPLFSVLVGVWFVGNKCAIERTNIAVVGFSCFSVVVLVVVVVQVRMLVTAASFHSPPVFVVPPAES